MRDVSFHKKTVLVRIDGDVPVSPAGNVMDDTRLRASLPTIQHIAKEGGRVVLLSHRGRPNGVPSADLSQRAVATYLETQLKTDVTFVPDCVGRIAETAIAETPFGQVIMLENTRFHPEETKNDPVFAQKLADLGDIYVFDAFATAHRSHASTAGVTGLLPSVAGFHVEKEIATLTSALENPKKPLLLIIGGAKISTKIDILKNLVGKADQLMIGGAMANTFLAAKDLDVGRSLMEPAFIETARDIMAEAGILGCRLLLPQDVVTAKNLQKNSTATPKKVSELEHDDMALDIGPKTVATWEKVIQSAGTVVWAGPLGACEVAPFHTASFAIAKAMAGADAFTLAGGGDTLACLKRSGHVEALSAISTAGGAFLDFMGGKALPVIDLLSENIAD